MPNSNSHAQVWVTEVVDSNLNVGQYPSISIDQQGRINIAYYDQGQGNLKHAVKQDSSWVTEVIDSIGDVGQYPSMAVDSLGRKSFSYYDAGQTALKYAGWIEPLFSWRFQTIDNVATSASAPSPQFDTAGHIELAYYDATNADLKAAVQNDTGWACQTIISDGNVGQYPSMAVDSLGRKSFSYYDAGQTALKYAGWIEPLFSWRFEIIDSAGSVGTFPAITLNYQGKPTMSYFDATKGNLKLADRNEMAWDLENVDTNGVVGQYSSLAFNGIDSAWGISYYDIGNSDLKYATRYFHNISALAIIAPDSVVMYQDLVTPQALIRNDGKRTETFNVAFDIGFIYSDTVEVTIPADDSLLVSFDEWNAASLGSFEVRCIAMLTSDGYANDDTAISVVAVVPDSTAPIIFGITPNRGGNTGSVRAIIVGQNFQHDTRVYLGRDGYDDINIDDFYIHVISNDTIVVFLQLNEAITGSWNVVVTNEGGASCTLHDGFVIESGVKSLLLGITGPQQIRNGRRTPFLLTYCQAGNVDLDQAIIHITVTSNAVIESNEPMAWTPDSVDFVNGLQLAFSLPCFGVGMSGNATFYLTPQHPGAIELSIDAMLNPISDMITARESQPDSKPDPIEIVHLIDCSCSTSPPEGTIIFQDDIHSGPCGANLRTGHEGIIWRDGQNTYVWENLPACEEANDPGGTRMTTWEDFCARTYPGGWQACYWPDLSQDEVSSLHNWLQDYSADYGTPLPYNYLTMKCNDAVHLAYEAVTGRPLIPGRDHQWWDAPSLDLMELTGELWGGDGIYADLWQLPANFIEGMGDIIRNAAESIQYHSYTGSVTISYDPNGKAAPLGFGTSHYINSNEELNYLVYFENVDSATANAESIWVADSLSARLDWSTFEFGEVYPGAGPDSIRPYFTCQRNFDSNTGVVTWGLLGINLPPDTLPYWGEGWVSYSIKPLANLPTGTNIENIASIKFDENDWILAPMDSIPVINTIDADAPSSHVNAFPDSIGIVGITASWSGADSGSGIVSYQIFMADSAEGIPGDTFFLWKSTSDTIAALDSAQVGHIYSFYSISTDGVGYQEAKRDTVEAQIKITGPPPCHYVIGDANGNGIFNGIDVIYSVNYLKGIGGAPMDSCDCPPWQFPVYAAADANGNCQFNGIDVTYSVNYLKGIGPGPAACADCPPASMILRPPLPAVQPIINPILKPKTVLKAQD